MFRRQRHTDSAKLAFSTQVFRVFRKLASSQTTLFWTLHIAGWLGYAVLNYLIGILESHGPASVRTCALVRKAESVEVEVPIDYLGFDIPDEWVVGYGLDYAEQNRTLPYIGTIKPVD